MIFPCFLWLCDSSTKPCPALEQYQCGASGQGSTRREGWLSRFSHSDHFQWLPILPVHFLAVNNYTLHCSNGSNDFQCFSFMLRVFSMNPFFPKHGSNLQSDPGCNSLSAQLSPFQWQKHYTSRIQPTVPPVVTSDLRFELIWPTVPQKIQWINVDHDQGRYLQYLHIYGTVHRSMRGFIVV